MQLTKKNTKYTHVNTNESTHDKMGPEYCENCSSKCAHDRAQLQYTIQHRTIL